MLVRTGQLPAIRLGRNRLWRVDPGRLVSPDSLPDPHRSHPGLQRRDALAGGLGGRDGPGPAAEERVLDRCHAWVTHQNINHLDRYLIRVRHVMRYYMAMTVITIASEIFDSKEEDDLQTSIRHPQWPMELR